MGLGPNLTLETAINPDFGQVEADPAEVNLTAFETRFPEKRPFFVEGAQLFNIGHPNFYYSRRIGARPIGPATGDYVDYPDANTIIAAAKLTGRLQSKTSIGFIAAVTDDEDARDRHRPGSLEQRDVEVAPHAYHMVGRVLQEFGPSASTAGLHRQLHASRFRGGQSARRSLHAQCDRRGRQHAAAIQGRPVRIPRLGRRLVPERQRASRSSAGSDRARTTRSGPIATTHRSIRR